METAHTINVVATPSQDSDENNEGYTFRKVLEDLMVFHLSVSGQTFPIGSKIPILLRIQPLTNIRIHKVSIEIEGTSLCFFNKTSVLTIASLPFNRVYQILPDSP